MYHLGEVEPAILYKSDLWCITKVPKGTIDSPLGICSNLYTILLNPVELIALYLITFLKISINNCIFDA